MKGDTRSGLHPAGVAGEGILGYKSTKENLAMPKQFVFLVAEEAVKEVPKGADLVVFQEGEDVVVLVKDEKWKELSDWIQKWLMGTPNWEMIPAQRKFVIWKKTHIEVAKAWSGDQGGGHYES